MGLVVALLLYCSLMRKRGAKGGEGRWADGRREGARGREAWKAVRGVVVLIVAADKAGVSGFISAELLGSKGMGEYEGWVTSICCGEISLQDCWCKSKIGKIRTHLSKLKRQVRGPHKAEGRSAGGLWSIAEEGSGSFCSSVRYCVDHMGKQDEAVTGALCVVDLDAWVCNGSTLKNILVVKG